MNDKYNITWAYIAGFIDCDGWVTFSKKYVIGLTQSNIFRKEMELISNFLNDNGVSNSLIERNTMTMIRGVESQKKMINIMIFKQESLILLCENVLPFSLIKKDKIINCLKWCEKRAFERCIGIDIKNKQPTNIYWKDDEINDLIEMVNLKYSYKRMAYKLNRSIDSISAKLERLKREKVL